LVYVGSSPSERSPCVITVRQDEAAQTPELRDRFAAEARKAFGMLPTEVAGATKSDDTGRVMDVIGPWIRGTLINVEWLLDLCAGFVHSPWDVVTLDGEASGILHLLRKMRQHYENRPSPDEPANPKSPELSLAALILTCTEALWVNRKSITIAPSVEVELPQEATPFRIFMERLFGDAGWGIEIDRARTANTSTWIFTPAIFISEDQVGEDQGSQA